MSPCCGVSLLLQEVVELTAISTITSLPPPLPLARISVCTPDSGCLDSLSQTERELHKRVFWCLVYIGASRLHWLKQQACAEVLSPEQTVLLVRAWVGR